MKDTSMTELLTLYLCKRPERSYLRLGQRLIDVGLERHRGTTKVLCSMDAKRKGSYEHEQFDLLGYQFR